MIREANKNDLYFINIIGSQIKEDFVKQNQVEKSFEYDYSYLFVYEKNQKVLAFIQVEKHFEILDIIDIAVDNERHNQGIATKMLNYVIKKFNCQRLMLEVKSNNINALNFYKNFGFVEINRRKKYYGDTDAIIMEKVITCE